MSTAERLATVSQLETPHAVNQEMVAVAQEIREATEELGEANDEAAAARWAYRRAKAEAFTRFKAEKHDAGERATDKDADAHVDAACADLGLARDMAEAREYTARQRHRALLELLDALRTRSSTVREEMRFSGTSHDPNEAVGR